MDLNGYKMSASDGDVGRVVNVLFDDRHWTVRYVVVGTGTLHDVLHTLISTSFFRQIDWATQRLHLALTKDAILRSPSIDADQPVTRRHEQDSHGHYGYPGYWESSGAQSVERHPLASAGRLNTPRPEHVTAAHDVHLRSVSDLRGCHIQGSDGAIGHVDDVIADDETWTVRYLVVETSTWWLDKKVLIAPRWASDVTWKDRRVHVNLSREEIKNSPEWTATDPVNRAYEERLYDYYGRPVYWQHDERQEAGQVENHPGIHLP